MKKWLYILLFPILAFTQKDNKINIGHVDTIYSKILNEKRTYLVHVPNEYYHGWFHKANYSVLYLLDGNSHFNYVAGMVDFLAEMGKIPPMIVIGITNTDRTRDLTLTNSTYLPNKGNKEWLKSSGGGINFLNFIKSELIPHIDSAHRTNKYRIFVGHSLGGIAAINALLTTPETFNAYISIDPSLWWDNQLVLKNMTKKILQPEAMKGKFLFMAKANGIKEIKPSDTSEIHMESISQMATYLQTRNHSDLKWQFKYYENDDHNSSPFISIYDGLRFIFNGYDFAYSNMYMTMDQWKKQIDNFSRKQEFTFETPEMTFNEFGWNALFEKNFDLAYAYLNYNVENFPTSPSAMESMANYWKEKGDKKKAISFYEKCLKLSPGNEGIKKKIDELR